MTTPNDAARPVARFDLCPSHRFGGHMEESETGNYVLFADYDALRAELDLRTSELIVHNRQTLACSEPVMDAYEVLRAEVERLTEWRRDLCERLGFDCAAGAEWDAAYVAADQHKQIAAVASLSDENRARAEAAEAKVARCVEAKAAFDKGLRLSDEAGHEVANLWTTKAIRLCAELLGAALNEGGE